jgi:hypothetical protein
MRTKLKMLDDLLTQLWNRFVSEYLPLLHGTRRWQDVGANLTQGDVVVILDKGLAARGKYPLGVIIDTLPDNDGNVRTVLVRLGQGGNIIERHTKGLAKLTSHLENTDNGIRPDIEKDEEALAVTNKVLKALKYPEKQKAEKIRRSRRLEDDQEIEEQLEELPRDQVELELEDELEHEEEKTAIPVVPIKRGRGRPRKVQNVVQVDVPLKRGRGRPRKVDRQ